MDIELSRRIAIARYLMIIGIVILHMPPFQPLSAYSLSPFDTLRGTLTFGVFRATVPFLTAISGYLLFSSGLDKNVLALFRKKTKTILVPLLIWNLPLLPILYFIQKSGYSSHGFSIKLYPFDAKLWLDAATGVFSLPLNYPTHFLRDLFALALVAPVLGLFLRKSPYLGLAAVVAVYWYNLDGAYLLRESMLLAFYIGGMAAVLKWNLRRLDPVAPFMLIGLLAMATAIAVFKIQNREWFALVSPLFVWPCISLIANTRFGALLHRHSKASFFTFLAHGPVLIGVWLLFQKFSGSVPYPVFWFVTPMVVVVGCALAHRLFWHATPRLAQIALGDRGTASRSSVSILRRPLPDRTPYDSENTHTAKSPSA